MIELPIAWILGIIGTLGGVIAGLSSLLWSVVKSRMEAQDKIIDAQKDRGNAQDKIIEDLRKDIERMVKGCGLDQCHWKGR